VALVDLLTDLSNFKYTDYDNVGVNISKKGGRHDGFEGGGEPLHPEKHSLLDDGAGENLSQIKGRHSGTEGLSPEFTIDHSRYDEELGSQFNTVEGIISSQYTDTEKLHSSYGTQFHISGFNRGDMYISDFVEPSTPIFNQFTRSDTSLIRIDRYSDNFDPNGDNVFDFPTTSTIPYHIPYHKPGEEHLQPFIIRDIGDKWGVGDTDLFTGSSLGRAAGFINDISGIFLRAPIDVLIDRSKADVTRISKFLKSPKGILFIAEQFILQAFNPTIETKVWNPLSLASIIPLIHINRHLGGARYTDALTLLDDSRIKFQSPLATVFGQKLPVDKRLIAVNPNKYLWPSAGGFAAAVEDAKRIEGSQSKVTGQAKKQSDGGIKDLFQKLSFNKYDSGNNVYLTKDGIMGTPEPDGPFGFLASLPLTVSEAQNQVTNALTNWATSTISSLFSNEPPSEWGSELELEERQSPDHRFSFLDQKNTDIPISGPLLNSPLAQIMASYYPGMQGSYSFPTHISGDLWPVYGRDSQYPVTKGSTSLISGTKLDGAWGVSLARFATGDANKHEGKISWKISGDTSGTPNLKDDKSPLAQSIVFGDEFKGDHWGPDRPGGTYEQFAFTNIGDRKYVQLFGGGDLQIGALTVKTHADDKHDVYSTEPLQGTITIPQFSLTKDMARPFQTPIFRTNVFKGDLYKKGTEYSKDYVYTVSDSHISITHKAIRTVAYKDAFHEDDTVLGAEKTYTVDLTKLPVPIKIAGVFQSDKYSKSLPYATSDSEPSLATIQSEEGPLIQLGHSSSVMALKNIIYIHSNFPLEGAKLGEPFKVITKLDHESDGKESKVFGEYPAIKLASQTHWHDGKNIYNTDDKYIITEIMSGRKDGRLPPSDEKRKQLFIGKEFWQTNIFGGANEAFQWQSDKWNKGAPYATSDSTPTLATLQSADGQPIQLGYQDSAIALKHIVHRSNKTAVGPLFDSFGIQTIFDHENADGDEVKYTLPTGITKIHDGINIYKDKNIYFPTSGQIEWSDDEKKYSSKNLDLITSYPHISTKEKAQFGLTIKGEFGKKSFWDGDLYSSEEPYTKFIGSLKEQEPKSLLKLTRLQIDDATGDPTVLIKTAHPYSSARFQTAGDSTLKEPIKLQNFPLLNKQGTDSSFGLEGQALGFVQESYGLFGNLFGITTRFGSGKYSRDYKGKVDLTVTTKNKGQLLKSPSELAQNVIDNNISIDKMLPYSHKHLTAIVPVQSEPLNAFATEGFKTTKVTKNLGEELAIKIDPVAKGSGNLIDTYSTLAYGKLSTMKTDEAGEDDQEIHNQLNYEKTLRSASEINKSFSGGRGEIIESESSRFGVSGGENVGRRDRAKQWKADDQGHPGKPDPTGAVWKIVNDDGLKGLVKKTFDDKYITALTDKINMLKYGEDYDDHEKDFIKFKFKDLINNKWIIFRAALGSISEEFSPEWSSERYIGRPDQVHVYQGVNRSLSFDFMIVPHTRQELPILWEKLNYLVGLTYPTWKNIGDFGKRMESPFMNLTIGDMYVNTPGFLSGLSVTVDDNSPWEIEEGFQLPHAINVSCEFTHIGRHTLASQGIHYDLGWLKEYDSTKEWIPTTDNPQLLARKQLTSLMGT